MLWPLNQFRSCRGSDPSRCRRKGRESAVGVWPPSMRLTRRSPYENWYRATNEGTQNPCDPVVVGLCQVYKIIRAVGLVLVDCSFCLKKEN
nr:hypothetical protein Q903MT_gene3497 [Picea sitchensis]